MSTIPLLVTSYVVSAFWQLPLLFGVAWCLARCLKSSGPELQHRVWVATLIAATLLPAAPILGLRFEQRASPARSDGPRLTLPAADTGRLLPSLAPSIVLPVTAIYSIASFHTLSLLFFALRLGMQIRRTATLVASASPVSMDPGSAAIWEEAKQGFAIQSAHLLRSDEVSGPVTAGFRQPAVIIPTLFLGNHSQMELLAAIAHECAHLQRNDYRKNLLYEVLAVLAAFHPVTWFIRSQIAQTREMACDQMASEKLLDRRAYAQCLLQLASKMRPAHRTPAVHTIGMFDQHVLERRLMTLMTPSPRLTRRRRLLLSGTTLLLLSICAATAASFSQPVTAASPDQPQLANQQESDPNLDCTYYDQQNLESPGTCGRDQRDSAKFACYNNQDPTLYQRQIGCEWKVLRAEQAKKK